MQTVTLEGLLTGGGCSLLVPMEANAVDTVCFTHTLVFFRLFPAIRQDKDIF